MSELSRKYRQDQQENDCKGSRLEHSSGVAAVVRKLSKHGVATLICLLDNMQIRAMEVEPLPVHELNIQFSPEGAWERDLVRDSVTDLVMPQVMELVTDCRLELDSDWELELDSAELDLDPAWEQSPPVLRA
jgi:hypothetical protein